jgi:cellulose synthase/poly-beta-1,6-N-acetylglucosamine synthase-like glycosyltransferase
MSSELPTRARARRDDSDFPYISVVIPIRNEERYIAGTLRQLQNQDYPPGRVEFLVCDGRSTDRTREIVAGIAEADPRVKLVDNPGLRSSAGRNAGFRAASGDLMLVIDGHVQIPDEQLLNAVADLFARSGADCLGRPQPLIAASDSPWAHAIVAARSSWLGHNPDSMIYSDAERFAPAGTMGAAYRRTVFARIGYVDEGFDACEDLEFNTRLDLAGLKCFTSPRLSVRYFARDTLAGLFKQQHRYGYGRLKYLLRYPSKATIAQLAPPGLVAATLGAMASPWLPLPLATPLLAGISLYLAIVAIAAGQLAMRRPSVGIHRYFLVFVTIHYAIGCGFWAAFCNWRNWHSELRSRLAR